VVLWVLVVLLACVVWALVRQVGVLHERIAPVGALMLPHGLKVGELAPPLEVQDLDGRTQLIGAARRNERSVLLAFVSPTCPVCKTLLPVLKSARLAERDWLDIILASDGDAGEHRQFIAAQALQGFSYVNSAVLGMTYQVSRLPYAVLIDEHGMVRARGLINSREHLESLFEAKRRGVASLQEYFERAPGSQAA
ncbi:MAG TPA: methylamine dehydrogenase accessory protein MauD, partial [Steroidobacteraceae bacterium]